MLGTSKLHKFEGDILLTEEQIKAIENGMDPNNVGGVRGLSKYRKWPGGVVPYTLHSSAGNSNSLKRKGSIIWSSNNCYNLPPYVSLLLLFFARR